MLLLLLLVFIAELLFVSFFCIFTNRCSLCYCNDCFVGYYFCKFVNSFLLVVCFFIAVLCCYKIVVCCLRFHSLWCNMLVVVRKKLCFIVLHCYNYEISFFWASVYRCQYPDNNIPIWNLAEMTIFFVRY